MNRHICVRQGPLEQDGEDGDARREEAEAAHRPREHGERLGSRDVGFCERATFDETPFDDS